MAGDAKGIRAGRAFVEVGVSDSALSKGLKRAAGRLKAFGASIAAIGSKMAMVGGAALAPLLGTSKVFADMGSNLWDMSKRTGVTVEALSVLGYAAQQSGTDMSSLETGLRKMQKTITNAAQGSQSAKDALAALGLTVQDIITLAPEEQFKVLAEQLDKVADPTQKAAMAMNVFGKSGTALLPMIEGGASALNEYEQAAKRLGLVMSTSDAKAADEFGDTLDDLLKTVKMAVFHVGAALAPALQKVAGQLIVAAKAASDWVTQNQGVVVGALQAAAAVTGVGLAMIGIGKIITGASLAMKVVGVAVAILGSPIALVAIGISAIAGALAYAGLAGDTFSAKMENLKSMVLPLVQATVEYIGAPWEWLVAAVQPILSSFSASVTTCFAAIWTTLQP
ncbi:MAG: hypothetical protein EHM48_09345, partial [Planctomycetaceae bacterium]